MSDVRDKNHSSVKKCEGYNFSKRLIPVRCDRLQTMFLYWEKLIWGEIEILLMTNNDNCIRTLLNTSLASKSPKIFPMGHTRDIHGYIHTNLSTQISSPQLRTGKVQSTMWMSGTGMLTCPTIPVLVWPCHIFILSQNWTGWLEIVFFPMNVWVS